MLGFDPNTATLTQLIDFLEARAARHGPVEHDDDAVVCYCSECGNSDVEDDECKGCPECYDPDAPMLGW